MKKYSSFIQIIAILLSEDIPLIKAVRVAAKTDNCPVKIQKKIEYIASSLEEGRLLSSVLAEQPSVFPLRYIMLVTVAERTGNLAPVMSFICNEETYREEKNKKLLSSSVYPLLVLFLVLSGTAVLFFCGNSLVESLVPVAEQSAYRQDAFNGIVLAIVVLFLYILFFFIFTKSMTSNGSDYDIFRSISFLTGEKFSINQAVDLTISSIKLKSKELSSLVLVLHRLREGVSVSKAFEESGLLSADLLVHLELAEIHGSCDKAFQRIVETLRSETEKKHELYNHLVEPLLIGGVGVFVVVILQTVVLPLLTQFGSTF